MAKATEWCSLNEKGYKVTRLLHSKYPRCHERLAKWESVKEIPRQALKKDHRASLHWELNEENWLHYKWEVEDSCLPFPDSKWGEGYALKNLTTHHLTKSGESYLYGVESQRPREWQEKQNRKDTK